MFMLNAPNILQHQAGSHWQELVDIPHPRPELDANVLDTMLLSLWNLRCTSEHKIQKRPCIKKSKNIS